MPGCTSDADSGASDVEWARSVCAAFQRTDPELSSDDLPAPAEPIVAGEIRELLVGGGGRWPAEWADLDDDDRLAQCTYEVGDVDASGGDASGRCPPTASSGPRLERTAMYLVDADGHGVPLGTGERVLPDC